jgi:hypothetical protein
MAPEGLWNSFNRSALSRGSLEKLLCQVFVMADAASMGAGSLLKPEVASKLHLLMA